MPNYKSITTQLSRCGLSWYHARVTIFITQVSGKYNRKTPFTPQELPSKACIHLHNILNEYESINSHLKMMGVGWDDPVIKDFFKENANSNRLTLSLWQQLKQLILAEYFPF